MTIEPDSVQPRSGKVAAAVRRRDGDICQCCGEAGGTEVHHIHPLCFGGADEDSNCICLCSPCHRDAPNDPADFLAYQRRGGSLKDKLVKLLSKDDREDAPETVALLLRDHQSFVDKWRNTQWGYMPGANRALNHLYSEEDASPGKRFGLSKEAAEIALERHQDVMRQVQWAVALLRGPDYRKGLPPASQYRACFARICNYSLIPRSEDKSATPRRAFYEGYSAVLREAVLTHGVFAAISENFECVTEDLCEIEGMFDSAVSELNQIFEEEAGSSPS